MTVKLLEDHGGYKAGQLFSSDGFTERALVDAGDATFTLSGGIDPVVVAPVATLVIDAADIPNAVYQGVQNLVQDENGIQYYWNGFNYVLPGTVQVAAGVVNLDGDVQIRSGAGVPVDYTDGSPPATGEDVAGIGSLYIDITAGKVYVNGGTKAQPLWKIVTSA